MVRVTQIEDLSRGIEDEIKPSTVVICPETYTSLLKREAERNSGWTTTHPRPVRTW